ncbi:MAG: tripartite tricarboxylate transporter substrate binding protein [Polaromonas sp.]|nr:tripartite tricarboxylate transporter substrate binding protein [Polaromonas sp.]
MTPSSTAAPSAIRRKLGVFAAAFAATLGLAVLSGPAMAQAWPSKPVRMIVPFPAGATPDVIARLVADRLSTTWGQPVIVDNRPGAGGIPGMSALVRSPNDGYTIGFIPAAVLTLTPELYKNPQFNPDTDIVPIAAVGTSPMMVVVNQNSDIKSMADLVKVARAQPGKITFAAAQLNSVPHLSGEMLGKAMGAPMMVVPYTGSAQAITALLSNEAVVTIDGMAALVPNVKAGKFRALAVMSKERLPGFETVPVAADTVKGVESIGWFSIYAPAGTPAGVVDKVNGDINKVVMMPDLVARLAELGVYPKTGTPKQLGEFVTEQRTLWKKVVTDLKLQPQ